MQITYTLADYNFIELLEESNIKDLAISYANKSYEEFVIHECDIIQMEF